MSSVSKSAIRILAVTAAVLLIPLVAVQFSDEVDWDLADFVVIGVLLIGIGLTYELVARKMRSTRQRAVLGVVLLGTLLLIWAELAVGVFGTPFAES